MHRKLQQIREDIADTAEVELEIYRKGRFQENIWRIEQYRNWGLIKTKQAPCQRWRGVSWPGKAGEDSTEKRPWEMACSGKGRL